MSDVLSQSEIDALLQAMLTGGGAVEEKKEPEKKEVKTQKADFKVPKKLKKDELQKVKKFTGKFVWELSQYYSNKLSVKSNFNMELASVELLNFADFNNAITFDSIIFVIDIVDKTNYLYVEIPLRLCEVLNGITKAQSLSNLSPANKKKILFTAEKVCGIFQDIFNTDLDEQQIKVKTRSMENINTFIPSVYYSETVGLLTLKVTVDDFTSQINICMPFNALNYIISNFNKAKIEDAIEFDQIREVDVDVEFVLGRSKVYLNDLNSLRTGDIILLDSRVKDSKVELLVDNSVLFYGKLGANEDRYAVKIVKQR